MLFSFVSYAGNKIMKTFQDSGYFDRNEISNVKAKYNPGLELQFTSESLLKHEYKSTKSICFKDEIGILYKLKYGEIGARVLCKSYPTAQFHATLRLLSDLAGYELTSMCVVDIKRKKLDKLNLGLTMIAGNNSGHLKLEMDKFVFSTRHRIHPRFVTLSETALPYTIERRIMSAVAMGFEFEVNSRTSLEVMVSNAQAPTFAVRFQGPNDPQVVFRVFGDVYLSRTGVSIAIQP